MAASQVQSQRTIIVAIDGSASSGAAFDTYMKLVRKNGDSVVLLTCKELRDVLDSTWKETIYGVDPELLRGKLGKEEAEAHRILQPFVDQLKKEGIKVKPEMVVCNHPGPTIISAAEKEDATLIVCGSRGMSTIRRTLVGSCSDYLLHHSHIPVMVCRQ